MANNEFGFSLIELLVTVAIVSVLAAIAVPEFQEYRARAYDVQAINFAKIQLEANIAISAMIDAGESSGTSSLNPEIPPKIITHNGRTGDFAGCVQECVIAGHELGTSVFLVLERTPIKKVLPMYIFKTYSGLQVHAATSALCLANLQCS